ncbi:MAG TPA: glutathione S-transferase [Variovorax sp.]|nr:glutathione S-transferase [Variovorax sp.]
MSEPLPILYSFRRCPYAMRARMALLASGQRCELREVVLRDKPPELLAVSPAATVPVLVLPGASGAGGPAANADTDEAPGGVAVAAAGDRVIVHSLDIMRWTLRRHDPLGWLTPGAGTLADLLALVADCDTGFKADLDSYKYPDRYPATPDREVDEATAADAGDGDGDARAAAHVHRDRGAAFLLRLEDRLARHPHLAGDHATLADAAILPFVRQFAGVDPAWFATRPWPRLRAALVAWQDSEAFATVMRRHAPWRAADGPGAAFP